MAIAGVLDAAEGQVRFGADGRSVDVNDTGLQLALRDEGVVAKSNALELMRLIGLKV